MKTIVEKQEDDVMERKKSAKDLAFEKERAKYRRAINELSCENKRYFGVVQEQKEMIASLETTVAQQKDWIDRLLNYCGLSDKEMRDIVEAEKNKAKAAKTMAETADAMGRIFTVYGNPFFS